MKKRKKFFLALAVLALLLFGGELYRSNFTFCVTHYSFSSSRLEEPLRLVQLTDLHSCQYGEDNRVLLEAISKEEPHLILMTGDMFSMSDSQYHGTLSLIRQASAIAPVFYSYGNHELKYCQNHGAPLSEIQEALTQAGAVVLEREYQDITVGGNTVRIGGFYGYGLPPQKTNGVLTLESAFLEEFCDTESFTLLLSHRFEGFLLWGAMESYDISLTLSGHAHGGQIRLPLVGGLYAQEEGFFPRYTAGIFADGDRRLILSRGLGSHGWLLRFGNQPELISVKILPEE